jgi:hypothetical protein
MATILSWVREPAVSTRFTIVRYGEDNLRMTVKDASTRTQYEVLFNSVEEMIVFLKASDSERAVLVKSFKG